MTTPRLRAVAYFVLICAFASGLAVTSVQRATAATAATGGSVLAIPPKIKKVSCVRACARKSAVQAGSVIKLNGQDLGSVDKIIFEGSHGTGDDVETTPIMVRQSSLTVRVPASAVSGRVVVVAKNGARAKLGVPIAIRPAPTVIGTPDLKAVAGYSGAGLMLETGTSTPRVVFVGASEMVRHSLRVTGANDVTALITVIRQDTGVAIASWSIPAPDGQIVSTVWDGTADGKTVAQGRYAFTVSLSGSAGPVTVAADVTGDRDRDAFDVYGFMFPVRGSHNFGQSQARFGAGRPGHSHQGQDVMARCSTKLVAARGGIVVQSRFQGAAGNFIVIRTSAGADHAYMHMQAKSPFGPGDRVFTGQAIGNVGSTGRSSACHLHFESWTAPGWWAGGGPVDPLADLLAWDAVS